MNSFKKKEKLCSKIYIDKLYQNGNSFLVYPLKVIFIINDFSPENETQVFFSVTKRRFKKAINRNLIKRRMRESYRLSKETLIKNLLTKEQKLFIAFNYVGNEIIEYNQINKAFEKSIDNLIQLLNK